MPSVERTITVDQPVARVWEYLSDFTTTEQWDPPTVSTVRTGGDGGVGTTYRNVSSFLGRKTETTYEVVRHRPPEQLELEGVASGMRLLDTITLQARAGGTTVRYRSEFRPQGAGRLASPLLAVALQVLGTRVASSLRRRLAAL